ncbi:MAG: hypothetical protein JNK21_14190 [Rhodospirillaceae bacterium]|nr:hypothetical protein [Rhodospirillaceae bacterium]
MYDDDDNDLEQDNEAPETAAKADTAIGSAPVDFARMGLNQIAYVRQAVVNNVPVWSIYSAAGDALGAAQTFEQAWGAVQQNNLVPLRVH